MMKRAKGVLLFVLLTSLAGCGSKSVVTGKVSYKNEPIARGDIHFFGEDGQSRSGVIAEGAYTIEDPPIGKVKVAVAAVEMSAKKDAAPSVFEKKTTVAMAAPASALPAKFGDPEKSNLVYEVKRGAQTINIELRD
jgi:hypothetical protein